VRLIPCVPWTTAEDVEADPRFCEGSGDPPFDTDALITRATEVMWVATGRKFGVCTATVRPIKCGCGCGCDCRCIDAIALHDPLVSVDEVKIDGVAFTDYHLIRGNQIARSDGSYWPTNQSLNLADSATGTFSITYTYGVAPPPEVVAATTELAVQFYMDSTADARCALPTGTTSLNRQGQSITIDLERVRATSNQIIATAVSTYNPNGYQVPSDIWDRSGQWELVVVSA
jgi:hypothetical protein